jgi:hypothetical protein
VWRQKQSRVIKRRIESDGKGAGVGSKEKAGTISKEESY